MELENIETIENFNKWENTLKKAVNISKMIGMKENTITDIVKRVGDFLSNHVDPENPQQRLLKQLWEVGNKKERQALAHLIVKMVENDYREMN